MEPKDLDKQISSGKIGKLYFFVGEEQFLMENKIKSIKSRLVPNDFEEFNFTRLDGKKIQFSDIEGQLLTVPVMSDKKLIVISNSGIFSNAKSKDFTALTEALADLPEYLTVIFTEREFDKKKEKNLEVFNKFGHRVDFVPLSQRQLELWLEKMFEKEGKTVLSSDISKIIDLCGCSMSVIHGEFSKLINFVGDRTKITAEDIALVVSKTTDARIFDIVDNIALGKTNSVFEELNALRSAGENPSLILSLISTRMGELLMIKQLSASNLTADRIAAYFEPRKHPYVVKKLTEQSRNFDTAYLKKMTIKGGEYAHSVRSGNVDKWMAVEMYVAQLLSK